MVERVGDSIENECSVCLCLADVEDGFAYVNVSSNSVCEKRYKYAKVDKYQIVSMPKDDAWSDSVEAEFAMLGEGLAEVLHRIRESIEKNVPVSFRLVKDAADICMVHTFEDREQAAT